MNIEDFKSLAKRAGLRVNIFFHSEFLDCYVAENRSRENPVTIYYPNKSGGVTLVTGKWKNKNIEFFKDMEQLISEMEKRNHG